MNQENEFLDEEGRIKVFITYLGKTVPFSANPKFTLRTTMDNLRKLSNTYPDTFWLLPEIDANGQRITYYLAKLEGKTIFHQKDVKGDNQSLEIYGVRPGDQLKIIRKLVAG